MIAWLFDAVGALQESVPVRPHDPPLTALGLVLASLLSDARDETAADGPRGWWADAYSGSGDRFGSRLWTLTGPVSDELLRTMESTALEALEWMKADGWARSIAVSAAAVAGHRNRVALTVRLDADEPLTLLGDLA